MPFQKGNTLRKGKGKADGQGRPKGSRDEVISARLTQIDAILDRFHRYIEGQDDDAFAAYALAVYPTLMRFAMPVHPEATTSLSEEQELERKQIMAQAMARLVDMEMRYDQQSGEAPEEEGSFRTQ